LSITASFGIASLWPGCASSEDWLAKADTALYAAKHGGRNRCLVAGDTGHDRRGNRLTTMCGHDPPPA